MNLKKLSRRTAAMAVAFGLSVVASPNTRVAAQQGQAFGQQVDVEGLLEVQIEDSDAGAIIHYSIDTANGRWDLKVPPGQIKNLLSGSDVQVRGKQTGQNSIDLGTDGTMTLLAPAAPNTFGVQRVAVIMVNFSDNQSISQTAADAANVTFGTVNNFYVENSYSQTSLTGDVFGWFTIPMTSAVCDTTTLAAQADQAVTNSGVNLSLYTRKIYSFPKNACSWWGLSTVGGSPSQSWINGTYSL